MNKTQRIAFIGNHLPRRCGIATFTHDLHRAVSDADSGPETLVVAVTDPDFAYDYPQEVRFEIRQDMIRDYAQAADFLNVAGVDVVSLQHEYGIYGGAAGSHIVQLLSRLEMPIVTTLHTVLTEPTPEQRSAMDRIIEYSAKIVVMAEKGREILQTVHDVPDEKIEIIPHGIPDYPFLDPSYSKDKFGLEGKTVILTFGLLSPNKGIETMIDAMPGVIKACPNAVYVVLGATHPNVVHEHGESYRESLEARVRNLGVKDHVVFFDRFVDQDTLSDFIAMSDVYVTPYLYEAQITSGTLAVSFGMGKAVVSTPYWHAKELLADDLGVLVPFGDAQAMSHEIASLLSNDVRRHSMRKRAYLASRSMTWEKTANRYIATFDGVRKAQCSAKPASAAPTQLGRSGQNYPDIQIDHFLSLCDSTGIVQHAVYSVPNRAQGYCVDDNARALLLSNVLHANDETHVPETHTARFAAYIQNAWNPETGRFRNFMSYDHRWLEKAGSEDAHGRALWALGECARKDIDLSRRRWSAALFKAALPAVKDFTSPRAWAFSLLGLDAYCSLFGGDLYADSVRRMLADKLMAEFRAAEKGNWRWFEEVLSYENARLSQALIQTGMATGNTVYLDTGLRSLEWLVTIQTAPEGHFRPVGTGSFGRALTEPEAYDQQPVEALATISACLAAQKLDDRTDWATEAFRAFDWFLGNNDLRTALIDPRTGACSDGLHIDRPNENKGAESALSYLLGLTEIRQFLRLTRKINNPQAELAFSA